MKHELIDPILEGYAALIRDLLDGDDRQRFAKIAAVAKMANTLQKQVATRVADIDAGRRGGVGIHMDDEGENDYLLGGGLRNLHQPRIEGTDVIREVVGQFQPLMQNYMAREEETRLRNLCTARTALEKANHDTSAIDKRIEALLGDMKEEKNADPNLVRTHILRGLEGGADGPRELQGDCGEPDRGGAEGAREVAEDGDEEGVAERCPWDLDGHY